jgi:hypothetical protein
MHADIQPPGSGATPIPYSTCSDGDSASRSPCPIARGSGPAASTDLALGGLNYQIEHHLFASMPGPNLAVPSR